MQLPIRFTKDSREPIYHQIEEQLKALIAGGNIRAGDPLPSIRKLSKDLEVSIITTRRAYQNLENQEFIRTVQGKGTFVAEVDNSIRQQIKVLAVYQAMERAVDTAIKHDYTAKQLEEIFYEVLASYQNEKGE